MRHILFLLFMAFTLQAFAQYPATGNKARLGWQTTGDGLVYRGAIGDTATLDPSGLNNAWMLLDTANGNLYAYRAKAWRLVSGGGGGGVTMPFDSVTFNVNETDASERELKYSEEKGYLQYGGLDSVQIPLLPGIWYVRNDTSVTIPKGTVVRATGTLGASGRIKVKHMIANGSIDAMYVLGIAMQDIAVGADGYVMTQGKIRQVNTTAYSEGAVLYADVDTLGGLTQTEPGNGFLKLPIAFVVHSASNGTLAVRIDAGSSLRDLHDVDTTGKVDGSVLRYDSTAGYWKASTSPGIIGSGTTNYLPKFTGSSSVGNSVVYETGSKIGIGNIAPETALDVSGSIRLRHTGSTGGGPIEISDRSSTLSQGINWNVYWDGATWKYRNTDYGALLAFNNVGDIAYLNTASGTAGGSVTFSERFRVKQDGTFGIGTNSPSRTLDVNGIGRFRQSGGNGGGPIEISDRSSANNQSINWNIYYDGSTWRYRNSDYGASIGFNNSGDLIFANIASGTAGNNVTAFRERLKINENGNVGIATASPSRPLHVACTTAIRIPVGNFAQRGTSDNGDIRIRTDTASMEYYSGAWRTVAPMARQPQSGLANRFSKFDASGLLDTSAVLTQSNGRIGIGVTPTEALQVNGTARATRLSVNTFGSQTLSINNYAPSGSPGGNVWIGNGGQSSTWASGEEGSSNVSIGIDALLNNTKGRFNTAIGRSALGNNTIGSYNFGLGFWSLVFNNTGIFNVSCGTEAMFSNTSGSYNTAIGPNALYSNTVGNQNTALGFYAGRYTASGGANQTSSASVYLGGYSKAGASGNFYETVIGYEAVGNGSFTTTIGSSYTTHTVFQYGETLLGYSAAQDKGAFRLQVDGEGYISTGFRVDYLGAFDANTIFQMPNTSTKGAKGYAWNTYSDARIKTSVSDIENALEKTMALRPVRYLQSDSYVENGQIKVSDTGRNTIGFIAQEVEGIVPEAVQRGSDTELWGMDYTKLIPMLTKAIQEQQAQIEALKKEIEALKNK